jgi:hypothetical protein
MPDKADKAGKTGKTGKNGETGKTAKTARNTRLMPPEEALGKIRDRIPPYCRWAVGAAFLMGLVTHMFFLVNKLPNGDDLSELYHYNSMVSSGRWLDVLSKGLVSYYSIPWA